ncbi:MAG: amidohydrolase family protein [Pyrinomonadaceae bacterium]|nr:amidohydrolase family protein [Phycisphaerales bacterium]
MPPIASSANRLALDYRAQASGLGDPVVPIIDIHTHIGGEQASRIYDQVRRLFGVRLTYSMTQLPGVPAVKDSLGDSVRFIAFPTFSDPDKHRAHRQGFLDAIEIFHSQHGSRILKIWNAPRLREVFPGDAGVDLVEADSPWRVKACELGQRLGMMFMIHIADPDTWFKTRYSDTAKFRTKPEHYIALERMLDRFTAPWIAAHMGGWPEDLGFLDGMLTRHPNLHLDTSATKWVVRALSMHPREESVAFFTKWKGRVLFGSDIVVTEDHLTPQKDATHPMADLADSPESAFDLYASRYYALRTMLETTYEGESPIADPDLMMVDPVKYDRMSAPHLRGLGLSREVLMEMYTGAAERVVGGWERTH